MTEHMCQIITNMFFVERPQVLEHKEILHNCFIFYRLHHHQFPPLILGEGILVYFFWEVVIGDATKEGKDVLLHLFNAIGGAENCINDIRAIVSLIKLNQIISDELVVESLLVSNGESAVRWRS